MSRVLLSFNSRGIIKSSSSSTLTGGKMLQDWLKFGVLLYLTGGVIEAVGAYVFNPLSWFLFDVVIAFGLALESCSRSSRRYVSFFAFCFIFMAAWDLVSFLSQVK